MPLLKDGFHSGHTYETKLWKDVKSGFTHFANNDVVIAKITPCFQNRKSAVIHDLPSGYGAGTTELHVLRDYTKMLYIPYSYYKVVVFIDPLQGLNTIFIIAILYLFYRYGYDI